jgi:hypothetical protein
LPWQELLAIETLKYKPDGRWAHPIVGIMIARQNGKSTFMALRILFGIYKLEEKMHLATAHKLTTSAEIFFKVGQMIEDSPVLQANFAKKYESKGSQEIRFLNGARYLIRAGNSAARGIAAPDVIHIDELREFTDEEIWSSMRFTQMSNKNPQAIVYSNAGHAQSVLLLKLRERGLAASQGADDSIGWFEWSAEQDKPINDIDGWYQANPSLGYTIHEDNIRDSLSSRASGQSARMRKLNSMLKRTLGLPSILVPTVNMQLSLQVKESAKINLWFPCFKLGTTRLTSMTNCSQTMLRPGFVSIPSTQWRLASQPQQQLPQGCNLQVFQSMKSQESSINRAAMSLFRLFPQIV